MTVVMMTTSLNVTDGTFKYGTKFMKPTQTLQMDHFRRILAAFSTDGTSHSHVLQAPLEPDAVKVRRKRKMGILKKKKKSNSGSRGQTQFSVRKSVKVGFERHPCETSNLITVFNVFFFPSSQNSLSSNASMYSMCVCVGVCSTVQGSVPPASCHTKAAFRSHLAACSRSTSHSHSPFLPLLQPGRSDVCLLCSTQTKSTLKCAETLKLLLFPSEKPATAMFLASPQWLIFTEMCI